ncbi:MAG: type II secretion system protein [Phycisphaerae bacterium]|nr:type II secretion system protein [Phycisphaerae bacterium]
MRRPHRDAIDHGIEGALGWRRAFTLVDALVSLAIVALLVALVVPAFLGSRDAARRTACATHLKAWGVATHLYRLDHADLLPLAPERAQSTRSDPRFPRLQDVFDPYLTSPAPTRPLGSSAASLQTPVAPWHCPADRLPRDISSYGYRPGWFMFNLVPYNPVASQLLVSRLAWIAPGTKVMFEDFAPAHPRPIDNPGSGWGRLWRSGVFDDGRVDWVGGPSLWGTPEPDPDAERPSSTPS